LQSRTGLELIFGRNIMAHDETKKTTGTDQQQAENDRTRELTDQELEKVSGGVRGGDDDLDDLEVERNR